MIAVKRAVRRGDQRAVSLIEQDAALLLRKVRQLRGFRLPDAGQAREFTRMRRQHDRLRRLLQYILMRGDGIYAVRIEYDRAGCLPEQPLHDRGDLVRAAQAAANQQRIRARGKFQQRGQCLEGKHTICAARQQANHRLVELDRKHWPRFFRHCQCHHAAAHTHRALCGKISSACIPR